MKRKYISRRDVQLIDELRMEGIVATRELRSALMLLTNLSPEAIERLITQGSGNETQPTNAAV